MEKTPLPLDLFIHYDHSLSDHEYYKRNKYRIKPLKYPLKKTYMPFFDELSAQYCRAVSKAIGKKYLSYYLFSFINHEELYTGDPYYTITLFSNRLTKPHQFVSNQYGGKSLKLHHEGYAYNPIMIQAIHCVAYLYSYEIMWIRWKSNIPGQSYIDPEDELDIKEGDLTLEICTEVPEAVLEQRIHLEHYVERPYEEIPISRPAYISIREYIINRIQRRSKTYTSVPPDDCHAWIDFMKDENRRPKKRIKPEPKPSKTIPYEILPSCTYPDVIFSLYFPFEADAALEEKAEAVFGDFREEWDEKHDDGIHDVSNAKELVENNDKKVVHLAVDFGNCNPRVIKSLVKWLEKSGLDIEKIIIS
jgi:hypothetical protein